MQSDRRPCRPRIAATVTAAVVLLAIPAAASGPSCFGDVDSDGVVGISDLLAVLQNWGEGSGTTDFSGINHSPDGVVDLFDFLGVLEAWGACE